MEQSLGLRLWLRLRAVKIKAREAGQKIGIDELLPPDNCASALLCMPKGPSCPAGKIQRVYKTELSCKSDSASLR